MSQVCQRDPAARSPLHRMLPRRIRRCIGVTLTKLTASPFIAPATARETEIFIVTNVWIRSPYPVERAPFAHVLADDFLPPSCSPALPRAFPNVPRQAGPPVSPSIRAILSWTR